jgi:uncharacterized protein YdaU (DUF1376 family)
VYYYQHHIGDFIRSTNRLNDCQCMVYLRLIWRYYESEAPLPKDPKRLAFMLGASLEDVTSILEHFFTEDVDCYRNKRCDIEIDAYRKRQEKGSRAAKARWENAPSIPQASLEDAPTKKIDANQEPITNNQEYKNNRRSMARPDDVSEQVWTDWLSLRRVKKAPVTATALTRLRAEATKAGLSLQDALTQCVANGWQGFEAEWIKKRATTVVERRGI